MVHFPFIIIVDPNGEYDLETSLKRHLSKYTDDYDYDYYYKRAGFYLKTKTGKKRLHAEIKDVDFSEFEIDNILTADSVWHRWYEFKNDDKWKKESERLIGDADPEWDIYVMWGHV